MKKIVLAFALCFSFAAQAGLTSKHYFGEESEKANFETEITQMYNKELKEEHSNLNLVLSAFAQKNELAFNRKVDHDADSGLMEVDLKSMFVSGSGKGGAATFGSSWLVPIRAHFLGSGLITETIGFIRLSDHHDLSDDTLAERTISIDKIIPFRD